MNFQSEKKTNILVYILNVTWFILSNPSVFSFHQLQIYEKMFIVTEFSNKFFQNVKHFADDKTYHIQYVSFNKDLK